VLVKIVLHCTKFAPQGMKLARYNILFQAESYLQVFMDDG